jgi:myo-inositol-1(or 4)-monophosphatase
MADRLQVLQSALRGAARAVKEWAARPDLQAKNKANGADPVTQGDLASQRAIIDAIGRSFPDDQIISEEIPGSHALIQDPDWSGWVLDPIDGTNNFSRGIRYYSVSIAWVRGGQPVIGGVISPNNDEIFIAERGLGATLNGAAISVSTETDFGPNTRVATSNIVAGEGTWKNIARLKGLGDIWFDIQGSTVLQMAELAAGRVDLFCHSGLKPWDSAAAFLLLQEAGALVVDLEGQPASWRRPDVVAGNRDLVQRFFELSDF